MPKEITVVYVFVLFCFNHTVFTLLRVWQPLNPLRQHTANICCRLGVWTVSGMCAPAPVWTSVSRIWMPVASHFIGMGLLLLALPSACSRDVCCTCWPPTFPSPPFSGLWFVWPFTTLRCTCVLGLCVHCGQLVLGSPGKLLPHP